MISGGSPLILLQDVCGVDGSKENISVEDKALRYVAKAADGSMRDALSLLDQCIAFYLGENLTYDKVLQVLGLWIMRSLANCSAMSYSMMSQVRSVSWKRWTYRAGI